MHMWRIYVADNLSVGEQLYLNDECAHRVSHVLRLQKNSPLVLFNGNGGEFECTISNIEKNKVQIRIIQFNQRNCESPIDLSLVQGISRKDKMSFTLQKATELGVRRIYPILTKHCSSMIKKSQYDSRLRRWQGIVHSACEQCGRNCIPEVAPVQSFDQWIQSATSEMRYMLAPGATISLSKIASLTGSIQLLVGPEGGLSADEQQKAIKAGFIPLRLGPRILRTETVAIAALAAFQSRFGDF